SVTSLGQVGLTGYEFNRGANGGGGAGGSILFVYESGSVSAARFNVTGGAGGSYGGSSQDGGAGGAGRLRLVQSVEVVNQVPIADAGADLSITDTDRNGDELVQLDGQESMDSDGSINSYIWSEDGVELAYTAKAKVRFTVGVHVVTLTVIDN